MEKEVKTLIKSIEAVQKQSVNVLSEFPNVAEGLNLKLEPALNFLRAKVGLAATPDSDVKQTHVFKPITQLMGEAYKPGQPITRTPVDLADHKAAQAKRAKAAADNDLEEVKAEIERWPTDVFMAAPTPQLLDEISDMALRGIAKGAGLPVTDENPKTVNAAYIDKIKAALKEQKAVNDLL